MTPHKYEAWLCIENHVCATHPTDKYFCWVSVPPNFSRPFPIVPASPTPLVLLSVSIFCTPSPSFCTSHNKLL
jgi:hypothetical protein